MTPLIYAAHRQLNQIVNHLTIRSKNLDEEGADTLTILIHYLLNKNFKMASKIIARGANIDHVNSNGKTALHICIENKIEEAIEFLIDKGANQHIMDPASEDCCDKAKKAGFGLKMLAFQNCNPMKKVKPVGYENKHTTFVSRDGTQINLKEMIDQNNVSYGSNTQHTSSLASPKRRTSPSKRSSKSPTKQSPTK